MERKEFLQSVGKGAAFALTFGCLSGCLREELDPLGQTDQMAETPTEAAPAPDPTATQDPTSTPTTSPPSTPEPPTSNALFTINLTSSEASALANNGGYMIKQNIVVAKNKNGEFVAATVICSHDLLKKVIFKNNEYYCTEHDARFDQTGKGLNSKGNRGLKIYQTSLSGDLLSVLA